MFLHSFLFYNIYMRFTRQYKRETLYKKGSFDEVKSEWFWSDHKCITGIRFFGQILVVVRKTESAVAAVADGIVGLWGRAPVASGPSPSSPFPVWASFGRWENFASTRPSATAVSFAGVASWPARTWRRWTSRWRSWAVASFREPWWSPLPGNRRTAGTAACSPSSTRTWCAWSGGREARWVALPWPPSAVDWILGSDKTRRGTSWAWPLLPPMMKKWQRNWAQMQTWVMTASRLRWKTACAEKPRDTAGTAAGSHGEGPAWGWPARNTATCPTIWISCWSVPVSWTEGWPCWPRTRWSPLHSRSRCSWCSGSCAFARWNGWSPESPSQTRRVARRWFPAECQRIPWRWQRLATASPIPTPNLCNQNPGGAGTDGNDVQRCPWHAWP